MLQPGLESQGNELDNHEQRFSAVSTVLSAPPAVSTAASECSQIVANRKTRIGLACKRCKRRKQRCDGTRPNCQACEKAGQACIYERIARPQYPGGKALYISALEERIALLEARLPDHAEDHLQSTSEENCQPPVKAIDASQLDSRTQSSSFKESRAGSNSRDVDFDDGASLVEGVAYLSLCASGTTDTNHEPYYVGPSSGAAIARVIQSSIYRRLSTGTLGKTAPTQDCPMTPLAVCQAPTLEESAFCLPDQMQARMLFDFFFERIHPRWPLLDRAIYEDLFDRQYLPGLLSITERSIMHLIYAITARFLTVTKKPCGVDDEAQLAAATGSMEHIMKQHDLRTVQFLILLGIHGQRSPYGAGAWSQVRYATSVCIEMGLHRKRSSPISTAEVRETEVRRRAFWSCYSLDRVTSIVLGRAFAIPDRDINVELPSADPEFWTLTHRNKYGLQQEQWSNVQPFIHIIKLDKIQSRIHKAVFRVDKDVLSGTPEERRKLDEKMSVIRKDLDEWLSDYPKTPKNSDKSTWMYDPENAYLDARDFYEVQYHKAVLFLFTVFLPILEISDERYTTCAYSAASVCNAYKRLSQKKTLTYTMISLHSCFVAGLTLVYCIWRDRGLFSYEVVEATQSCSQILTIFGEKWPGAVKYRDIFDALSQSLFRMNLSPKDSMGVAPNYSLHRLSIDKQASAAGQDISTSATTSRLSNSSRPNMSDLMTDAVKEAFMEVDEEAPGGWQGWRMWNDMVAYENSPASRPSDTEGMSNGSFEGNWNSHISSTAYRMDPVQDAAMRLGNEVMYNQDPWSYPLVR
ncbi:fungal specific transcription factor domain-containing protein [Stagonosporopsis vannaccii]|nr:fungal specific transcription factor domain-containing protein [Stagonosporopsis vannaccii]